MMNHFQLIRNLCTILLFLSGLQLSGQSLVNVDPEKVGMSTERLDRLTRVFDQYIEDGDLAGSVILVARKNQVPYFKSFGNRDMESGSVMDKDAVFRIASQTKAIVSVGVMILQEQGKLVISDPVGKYLPAFQETKVAVPKEDDGYEIVKADRPITIRDLLTHTSGIGYGGGPAEELWKEAGIQGWYFADRKEPIQTTVDKMADLPFEAQPGEKYVYGYSTDILGALIEVSSGQPLDAFLKQHILDPLGMVDTHFYLPKDKIDRLAVVYSATEDGLKRAKDPGGMVGQGAYVNGPRSSFSGGAGYLSTAMDYARFLQMMLNKGELDGFRILSRKSVESMTVNHLGKIDYPWAEGTCFGLGFSVIEDLGDFGSLGSEGSFGWGGAYHSVYWVDPKEELIVVYFTQLIPANGLDDHKKLRTLVYQALTE